MNLHPTKTNPLLRKSDHSIVFLELPEFFPSVQETAHITGTHSLSLSSVHFLLRTATIEIETCDFLELCCFFLFIPLSLDFLLKFLFAKNALLFYYSKKFSTWFFLSLSLSLHFCLSVSASAFVPLCLRGVYGSVHSCYILTLVSFFCVLHLTFLDTTSQLIWRSKEALGSCRLPLASLWNYRHMLSFIDFSLGADSSVNRSSCPHVCKPLTTEPLLPPLYVLKCVRQ